jgi:hypothetical protein
VKPCFLYKTTGDCDGAPEVVTVRAGQQLTSAAVSVLRESVQISRYLLVSCGDQRSVTTRPEGQQRETCLLHLPQFRRGILQYERTVTSVTVVWMCWQYLDLLTSVFDVCASEQL